jgi:hypothetical protein
MTTRETSLGAWADAIPRVDGWDLDSNWKDEPLVIEPPLTPDEVAHEFKQIGTLFLMGLAPILVAGWMIISDWHILSGEQTSGTIVDLRAGRFPVARFYVAGQKYSITGHVWSRSPIYHLGDPVNIRYFQDDPSQAVIDSFLQLYLFPSILAGVGSVFVLIAVGSGIRIARKPKYRAAPVS